MKVWGATAQPMAVRRTPGMGTSAYRLPGATRFAGSLSRYGASATTIGG
ncbi:hypothetical protein ACIP6X_36175 [Streptomyces coeruleorubidus]